MAVELDNLHYDFREVDGYGKPWVFVMSPREPGKTVAMWFKKIYVQWKRDKKPWIILTRTAVEISEAFLYSIQDSIINKFSDDAVKFQFTKSTFKDGIVDVKISGEMFFRVVSLSLPLRRIKLAVLRNAKGAFMDEYIIDPKSGEKYIPHEAFKIKEAFTTWRRECEGTFRMYFVGNPYSLFNPLFVSWNVQTEKLRKGSFYVGDMFVIHWATLHPMLREKLLKENPLYQFDEDYNEYALQGTPVNDKHIPTGKHPDGFPLRFVFRVENKLIGIFRSTDIAQNPQFFCSFVSDISKERDIWCFDLQDIMEGTQLLSMLAKSKLARFKDAIARGEILYSEISVYYMIVGVFKFL